MTPDYTLPPIDPNVDVDADADPARAADRLRRLIAEGHMSPSRQRMAEQLVREFDKRAAGFPDNTGLADAA